MPRYLLQVSYTAQGASRILKKGGSQRRAAVEQLRKDIGGIRDAS